MSGSTEARKDVFSEETAKAYNKMASNHAHPKGPWPLMTEAVKKHMSSGLIIDLASGPGQPAATIAQALPEANVISTDLNETMVNAARENTLNIPNMCCMLADMENLSAYKDNSVDAVTCCYGYMFPGDKEKALAETYRVLKPGGLLVATTWDRVDILAISKDIMTGVLGQTPPAPDLNPMSLAEEGLFHGMVTKAGFKEVEQSTSTYPFDFGEDKSFQFTVSTILLKDKIDEFGEEGWKKAKIAYEENIAKYTHLEANGTMIMPQNTFRMTLAKK
jgi:ubiquinone/menaquinone biosynthesis C-methylase UbiE